MVHFPPTKRTTETPFTPGWCRSGCRTWNPRCNAVFAWRPVGTELDFLGIFLGFFVHGLTMKSFCPWLDFEKNGDFHMNGKSFDIHNFMWIPRIFVHFLCGFHLIHGKSMGLKDGACDLSWWLGGMVIIWSATKNDRPDWTYLEMHA